MSVFGKSVRTRVLGLLAVFAVVAGILTPLAPTLGTPDKAVAADLSQFDAGNIIADRLFWDPNAMSQAEIQAFLEAKVPNCRAGYTCLKNFTENTRYEPATPMCSEYTNEAQESAARIIWKVAQACGISPKVLLVMLEKEQGLVTDTWPVAGQYRSAMGAGCPDTAACDSDYYGFFNQLHYAGYLLKRYTQPSGTGPGTIYTTRFDLRYPVGQYSDVRYHPNVDCGTKRVYIANQATHALYIYTPYTPNSAALAAGYRIGDSCSAYGNRNFFNYYTDWFGSTQGFSVGSQFTTVYNANGGANGFLGYPTMSQYCGLKDGGCYQSFENGFAFWSPSTGAQVIKNNIRGFWGRYGYEAGSIGYPTGAAVAIGGSSTDYTQTFQGGTIKFTAAAGPELVAVQSSDPWTNAILSNTWLGRSQHPKYCGLVRSGCYETFENGFVFSSPTTGVHIVRNSIRGFWGMFEYERGPVGYPIGDPVFINGSTTDYTQAFENAIGKYTAAGGPVLERVTSGDAWIGGVVSNGWLGSPHHPKVCVLVRSGCYQKFDNGFLFQSPASGTHFIKNEVRGFWGRSGYEWGRYGYPTSDPMPINGSSTDYTQTFENGTLRYTAASGPAWIN